MTTSIQLVAIDIDETLLDSHGRLTKATVQTIQQATQTGVKIVLCTGRPLAGVQPFLDQLGLHGSDQYVITYNGGLIQTLDGEILSRHTLTYADYLKIDRLSHELGVAYNVLDDDSNIYTSNRDINRWTVVQATENSAGIYYRQPNDMPTDFEITKGVFVGDGDQFDAQCKQLTAAFASDDYYVVRSVVCFLEILNSKAHKGNALNDLAAYLNLTPANIMAIGDASNDLTMLAYAGLGVAMGNATTDVKAAADVTTATNNEDGVAQAIQKYVLNAH